MKSSIAKERREVKRLKKELKKLVSNEYNAYIIRIQYGTKSPRFTLPYHFAKKYGIKFGDKFLVLPLDDNDMFLFIKIGASDLVHAILFFEFLRRYINKIKDDVFKIDSKIDEVWMKHEEEVEEE